MVLFLITGILFILDGLHSGRQAAYVLKKEKENYIYFIMLFSPTGSSSNKNVFFPAPLNQRVIAMQPLLKPEPAWQPPAPPPQVPLVVQQQPWQLSMPPFNFQQQPGMYPSGNLANPPFFEPQGMMMMPASYGMEQYPIAPITEGAFANYFRQMLNNPQLPSLPYNQGLMNYSDDNPLAVPDNPNNISINDHFNQMARQHLLQQQRLNYNHERLLEKYSRLRTPRISEFRTFGTSSLPGRNYDEYLQRMRGNRQESSLAGQSRAGIGLSDETYRWMGDESSEPLPRGVSSVIQHNRDESMPFVDADNFEPVKMYNHPIFGPTPAYIRPLFKNTKQTKKEKTKHEHLVPVNPLLFKIYTQRSNGSIQSYGQSLYVPSGHYSRGKRLTHYRGIFTSPSSETGSISTDVPRETSSSSEHRYNKLHSQPTATPVSHRRLESFSTG
jgi:hypothetical protein